MAKHTEKPASPQDRMTPNDGHVPLVPRPRMASVTLEWPTRENPYRGLSGFLRYLRGKRYELQYLDANDLWMYFTVTSLYWHTERTECRLVPLDTIKSLHPIVRSTAVDLLEDRTKSLTAHRRDIIETGRVDRELQDACMPSVSTINVVAEDPSNYIAFEGNGRLEAIRRVVARIPGVLVEVVVYHPTNHESCVGRMRHLRTRNGMAD
jgi:hypothetical protein